jgi:hypothetical protein
MTSVDNIVKSALAELGLPVHYYMQFMHYAVDFLGNELYLDTAGSVKTTKITINSTLINTLPSDYIDYVRVGMNRGKYIVPIPRRPTLMEVNEELDTTNLDIIVPFDGYYWANYINSYAEHYGKFYGTDSDGGDHFNIVGNKIVFGYAFNENDTVYLQYLSNSTVTSTTLVHPYYESAMIGYIHWKFSEWNKADNMSTKERAKRAYMSEYRKARARRYQLTPEEIVLLLRRNTKQTTKL